MSAALKRRSKKWTEQWELACDLAFEGRWTHDEIAEKCHIAPRTYRYWVDDPDFQARLDAKRADLVGSLRGVAYANKAQRVMALAQMAESARREYEARPLLTETRINPSGETTTESFNRDAHAAFRESLNDIAKELGERSSNVNVSAQVSTLGISVVLERLRSDPNARSTHHDLLSLVAGVGRSGE